MTYIKDRTEWAMAMLRSVGLDGKNARSAFEKRVCSSVLGLMRSFSATTHTVVSAEFTLSLFERLVRGEPITMEFLQALKHRLESMAPDAAKSKEEEENAWLADRYGIDTKSVSIATRSTRKMKDSYGSAFGASKPFLMDSYGADYKDRNTQSAPETKEKEDMCLPSNDLTRAVRSAIESLCDSLTPFTGLDISNAVKRTGLAVRHRDVAPIVRELYSDGDIERFGYERSLITVSLPGGRQAKAWLYHHATDSVDNYDTRAQVALPPKPNSVAQQQSKAQQTQPNTQKPQPIPMAPDTVCAASSDASTPPSRTGGSRMLNTSQQSRQKLDGRLEIPRRLIRSIGWKEGDHIVAVKDGDGILLKKASDATDGQLLHSFMVDRWNRIRITSRALSKVNRNFGHGGQHTITMRTDSIRVE